MPILPASQDIKQWLTFRTNNLKKNQLYIWHATQFDWIPLWSLDNEFLLTELDRIPYDNVSYNQLTKSQWIKQNSVNNEAIQILLTKFKIDADITKMTPILNQQQQNGIVPPTGQPYYLEHLERNPTPNLLFNRNKHGWNDCGFYNFKMNKFKLSFLYDYRGTIHQCDSPKNNKQHKNIQDAVQQVNEGTYIYHEGNYYIPFEKFHEKIWFNAPARVKIVDITPVLEENAWTSNSKNYLAKEQYNYIYSMASSIFIDPRTSTYRDEYLINNSWTIPKYFWERAQTFDELFINSRAHHTLCYWIIVVNLVYQLE